MKRNKIPKIIGIALLIFICLLFLTPDLALRAAVFWRSPVKAFTIEYEEDKEYAKTADLAENETLYRITKNVPYEEPTDGDLVMWVVKKWGPFYIADYYGW